MYYNNPLPKLNDGHLDLSKIQCGMTFNWYKGHNVLFYTPQNGNQINKNVTSSVDTYIVLYFNQKDKEIVVKQLIDKNGNFVFHLSTNRPFSMSLEYFLNILYLKKSKKILNYEFDEIAKVLKPHIFGKTYVKNEQVLNLVTNFVEYFSQNHLKFKITLGKTWNYTETYHMEQCDKLFYEMIYTPKMKEFYKVAKAIY